MALPKNQLLQWETKRPVRANFDSGLDYIQSVREWTSNKPAPAPVVSRGTPTPTRTPTKPPVAPPKPTLETPPKAPTKPVVSQVPLIPPKEPPPLINRKEIIGVDGGPLLPDMGPGDRLNKTQVVKTPAKYLDEGIAKIEKDIAADVSFVPGKSILPIDDRISQVVSNIASQTGAGTPSRYTPSPTEPDFTVDPVGKEPPSPTVIEDVLDSTAQLAADLETEARRQLFYRGQVKRRGGIRMLFGKYAFPTPRKLAPATATAATSITANGKKQLISWKDVPEEYRLVPDYLRPPQYSEKAFTAKENIKEGWTAMGGEERWKK